MGLGLLSTCLKESWELFTGKEPTGGCKVFVEKCLGLKLVKEITDSGSPQGSPRYLYIAWTPDNPAKKILLTCAKDSRALETLREDPKNPINWVPWFCDAETQDPRDPKRDDCSVAGGHKAIGELPDEKRCAFCHKGGDPFEFPDLTGRGVELIPFDGFDPVRNPNILTPPRGQGIKPFRAAFEERFRKSN